MRGKAKVNIIQDIDSIVPICESNMKKYLGSLEHPMAKELVNLAKRGESVAIEISPLYFSTWDDNKIKWTSYTHLLIIINLKKMICCLFFLLTENQIMIIIKYY